MNKTDRLQHVDSLLRFRRGGTLAFLREENGESRATLMRDLEWLRDNLGDSTSWNRQTESYRWTSRQVTRYLPQEVAGLWFKSSEAQALLTLQHLIEDVPPSSILNRHIKPIEQLQHRILESEGFEKAFNHQRRRVRIIGLGQRAVPPRCFEVVEMAPPEGKRLSIRYQACGTDQSSERTVSPQRLIHYRSNWLLDAWCHEHDELRSFTLDNISQPQIDDAPAIDVSEDELDQTLDNGDGIFSGKAVKWATLRFSPERACWVAAEQWHPKQKGEWGSEGHWLLQIPYSDDWELVMDVLRHTPEVEVLGPSALRKRVMERMREGLVRWGAHELRQAPLTMFSFLHSRWLNRSLQKGTGRVRTTCSPGSTFINGATQVCCVGKALARRVGAADKRASVVGPHDRCGSLFSCAG